MSNQVLKFVAEMYGDRFVLRVPTDTERLDPCPVKNIAVLPFAAPPGLIAQEIGQSIVFLPRQNFAKRFCSFCVEEEGHFHWTALNGIWTT